MLRSHAAEFAHLPAQLTTTGGKIAARSVSGPLQPNTNMILENTFAMLL